MAYVRITDEKKAEGPLDLTYKTTIDRPGSIAHTPTLQTLNRQARRARLHRCGLVGEGAKGFGAGAT